MPRPPLASRRRLHVCVGRRGRRRWRRDDARAAFGELIPALRPPTPSPALVGAARKMPTIDEEAQRHAECTSAVVISGLLSAVQVDMCLEAGEVWPHMCEMSESCGGPCAGMLCAELEGRAHDLAYPDEAHPDQTSPEGYDGLLHAARQRDGAKHIMMYLHREGFIQQWDRPGAASRVARRRLSVPIKRAVH